MWTRIKILHLSDFYLCWSRRIQCTSLCPSQPANIRISVSREMDVDERVTFLINNMSNIRISVSMRMDAQLAAVTF